MSLLTLGYLIGFLWFFLTFSVCLPFFFSENFPYDFLLVRLCRGLQPVKFPLKEDTLILHHGMIVFLIAIFNISFFIRISSYKKKHKDNYHFGNIRQSVCTVEQLFSMIMVCLMFCLARLSAIRYMTGGRDQEDTEKTFQAYFAFDLFQVTLECVVLPAWMLYSCWNYFPELWSTRNTVLAASSFQVYPNNIKYLRRRRRKALTPRGPLAEVYTHKRIANEEWQNELRCFYHVQNTSFHNDQLTGLHNRDMELISIRDDEIERLYNDERRHYQDERRKLHDGEQIAFHDDAMTHIQNCQQKGSDDGYLESPYNDQINLTSHYDEKIHDEQSRQESLNEDQIHLTSLYDDQSRLTSLHDDQSRLTSLNKDQIHLTSLYDDQSHLTSLHDDHSRLTSLYDDQNHLASLYDCQDLSSDEMRESNVKLMICTAQVHNFAQASTDDVRSNSPKYPQGNIDFQNDNANLCVEDEVEQDSLGINSTDETNFEKIYPAPSSFSIQPNTSSISMISNKINGIEKIHPITLDLMIQPSHSFSERSPKIINKIKMGKLIFAAVKIHPKPLD